MPAVAPAVPPATRGIYVLDVESWVQTTLPQLFRAAAVVIAGNTRNAAPLGVATLMAFFEPYICCRRRVPQYDPRKNLLARPSSPEPLPKALARASIATPGAQEKRNPPYLAGGGAGQGEQRVKERRKSDGDALPSVAQDIREASAPAMNGAGRGWEAEVEAAAAIGAALAAQCGSIGDELVSRMALEAVGLLVEGFVGQQVIGAVM